MRSIQLALACYRYISIPSLISTAIVSGQLWLSHTVYFIVYAIVVKTIVTGLLMTYISIFRSGEFYFFNNLGLSNLNIYKSILIVDSLITFLLFAIALTFL